MGDLENGTGTVGASAGRVLSATAETAGRLDKVLADALPDLTRSRLKALIEDGLATIDEDTVRDPSARVKPGQRLTVAVPPATPAKAEPQAIPLDIIYEDDWLLVVNKPAGLVVHPAPGNRDGTLVNALLAHCGASLSGIGGVARPGIVHRLDKDTSGLMVVAKTDAAHVALKAQFLDRSLTRTYWALARGVPWPRQGTIDAPIGRSPRNRKKMAVIAGGRPALTDYRTTTTFGKCASLLECRLKTGRTHQIRVHLASIGHSVIGDPLYGRANKRADAETLTLERQALHAKILSFIHPSTQQRMRFEADIPNDMKALVKKLELIQ
ncbi:MAG: RluA family pseudouridine synthase [Pseudomonadota bacterium]